MAKKITKGLRYDLTTTTNTDLANSSLVLLSVDDDIKLRIDLDGNLSNLNTAINIANQSVVRSTSRTINFVEGTDIVISVVDDPSNNQANVVISSTASGSNSSDPSFAFDRANNAQTIAIAAFASSNAQSGVNNTQNTSITTLQGVDTTQNTIITAAFASANAQAGVNDTQNTSITTLQGVDSGQNTIITAAFASANAQAGINDTQNTIITAAFASSNAQVGVNNTQNTSITTLQGVDTTQNTIITASFAAANAQSGVNDTQNTTISGIQGVDTTQNTIITAAFASANAQSGVNDTQNTIITAAFASANAQSGVNDTQNTSITVQTNVNNSQNTIILAAFAKANTTNGHVGWINVKAYGAIGDGSTDDTNPISNALTYLLTNGGGTLYFPVGIYKVTSQLNIDTTSNANRFDNRVIIIGDGPGASALKLVGYGGPLINVKSNTAAVESHFSLSQIRLTGDLTSGSIGLKINACAYTATSYSVIEGFDVGMDCWDMDQSLFEKTNFRWNNNGIKLHGSVSVTDTNSVTFLDCAIGNNYDTGLYIRKGNNIQIYGGSVQYCGTANSSNVQEYGVYFDDVGSGYATVTCNGVSFEGNGGIGDIRISQNSNPSVYSIIGCGFARTSVGYGNNNIRIDGTNANLSVQLISNAFRFFSPYTEAAYRTILEINNTNTKLIDDGSNYYQSTTEGPFWKGYAFLPVSHQIGTGITSLIAVPFRVRHSTNNNLVISGPFTLADGATVTSVNDGNSSLRQLELRGSNVSISAPLLRGTTQILTSRQTGWTAATGNSNRATFATSTVTLGFLAERVKSLIDDLITHGLIGA